MPAEHDKQSIRMTADRLLVSPSKEAGERKSRAGILINNAATNPQFGPLIDAEMATVAKVWDVNIAGPFRFTQAAWRAAMKERGGAVLNVVSLGGIRVGP